MNQFLPSLALFLASVSACCAEAPQPVKLPTFPSGEGKGQNAVYHAKNFDATLGSDPVLLIQPKSGNQAVGKPFQIEFFCGYVEDLRTIHRKLVSLSKVPKPAMQPKKIELGGQFEDRVKFEVEYVLSEEGIAVRGSLKEPSGIERRSHLIYFARFSQTHAIPQNTPEEEVKRLTEGYDIKLNYASGEVRSVRFWETLTSEPNLLSAAVSGPWGQRKLLMETSAAKRGQLGIGRLWNYVGGPLYKGNWVFGCGTSSGNSDNTLMIRVQ
jgi:hypothetical protein